MRGPRLSGGIATVARVVAALVLFASLFTVWRLPSGNGYFLIFWGPTSVHVDPSLGLKDSLYQDGWERWRGLDVALTVLAGALLCTTVVRVRALAAVLTAGAVAATLCVTLSGFSSASPGPYVATAALLLAIVALAPLLRRRRAPTL